MRPGGPCFSLPPPPFPLPPFFLSSVVLPGPAHPFCFCPLPSAAPSTSTLYLYLLPFAAPAPHPPIFQPPIASTLYAAPRCPMQPPPPAPPRSLRILPGELAQQQPELVRFQILDGCN